MLDAFLMLTSLAMAGGDPCPDSCPDQVAVAVPPKVTTHSMQQCGTGIKATFNGVHVSTPVNQCPLFAIITPGHSKTVSSPGSCTYTVPQSTLPIRRLDFACSDHWLLGVIPITVSSSCMKTGESNAGAVTHYVQHRCECNTGDQLVPTTLPPAHR